MEITRRGVLSAAGAAIAGGLAGCVSGGQGSGGDAGLTLPSLAVGGSPGGEVVVKPDGTVTLLDFFATWCAPCKPQMEHLRAIESTFPDVHLLSITRENDQAAIESFWTTYEGTWPVARDPELEASSKYNATNVPTMILLDAEGSEVWRHVGLAAEETIADQIRTART